jgi:hypothetical protein
MVTLHSSELAGTVGRECGQRASLRSRPRTALRSRARRAARHAGLTRRARLHCHPERIRASLAKPRGRPARGIPAGLLTDLVNGSSRLVRCHGGRLRVDTFSVGAGLSESIETKRRHRLNASGSIPRLRWAHPKIMTGITWSLSGTTHVKRVPRRAAGFFGPHSRTVDRQLVLTSGR